MKRILFLLTVMTMSLTYMSCSKDDDPCDGISCKNGGACVEGSCHCPVFFSGSTCETQVRTQYFGTYTGTATDNGFYQDGSPYTFTVSINTTDASLLKIVNGPFYYNGDVTIVLTSATTFSIPKQEITTDWEIKGSGTFSGKNISMTYHMEGYLFFGNVSYDGEYVGKR